MSALREGPPQQGAYKMRLYSEPLREEGPKREQKMSPPFPCFFFANSVDSHLTLSFLHWQSKSRGREKETMGGRGVACLILKRVSCAVAHYSSKPWMPACLPPACQQTGQAGLRGHDGKCSLAVSFPPAWMADRRKRESSFWSTHLQSALSLLNQSSDSSLRSA